MVISGNASDPRTLFLHPLEDSAIYYQRQGVAVWVWDQASSQWIQSTGNGGGDMFKSQNLAGLSNNATARTNLGLGSIATHNTTDFVAVSNGTLDSPSLTNEIFFAPTGGETPLSFICTDVDGFLRGSVVKVSDTGVITGAKSITLGPGDDDSAQLKMAVSSPPEPIANGDIWFTGTALKIQIGGVTKTFTVS